MTQSDTQSAGRRRGIRSGLLIRGFVFLLAFHVYLTIGFLYSTQLDFVSTEGMIRTGIAGDIHSYMGRQGMVCSIVYPPLQTIVVAALSVFPVFFKHCFAAVVGSALFGAVAIVLFDLVCEELVRRRLARYVLLAAFLALPPMVIHASGGTSTPTLVSAALGLLYCGIRWVRTRELKFFLGFAVLAGLSLIVNWRGIPLGILAIVLFVITIFLNVRESAERRGLFWALAFPLVYVIAAWVALNWVIMEDPLFAFRVLWRRDGWWQAALAFASNNWTQLASVAVGLIILAVAWKARRLAVGIVFAGLGLLSTVPWALARGAATDFGASEASIFLAIASLLFAAYVWWVGREVLVSHRTWLGAFGLVVLIAVWAVPFAGDVRSPQALPEGITPHLARYVPPESLSSRAEMERLMAELDTVVPKGKLIADGFYGYPMWYYGLGKGRLIRTLDFSGQTLEGTRGPYYVVIPTPAGTAMAEDVHVKFPGIDEGKAPFTGYYFFSFAEIGPWQVYKLVD